MRIYVGAGPDAEGWSQKGWVCNDLASVAATNPHIALAGPCWALAVPDGSADEIMAKGMLEHLTYHEVMDSFREWARVLKPGGFFTVEVPDVVEYLRQYFQMKRDPALLGGEGQGGHPGEPRDFGACEGLDRWLRRALWGWQRWPGDEHRSGWTEDLLGHYLGKFSGRYEIRRMAYSFEEDTPDARMRHLWARAWKP